MLEEKGIPAIHEIPESGSGTVLIRAHGVPPTDREELKKAGFKIIDATCPRVIKVQTIIRKHARQGYAVIIIGDKNHPEVIGLNGYADDQGHVVNTLEELDALPSFDNAIIVAQTTQNSLFFEKVTHWAATRHPHYKIFNTICDSTEKRQNEIHSMAQAADAVIVVGGRNSGNTQRLAEIARQAGTPAFHIENESELDLETLASARTIAITAGASTPNWVIKKVYRALESALIKKKDGWQKKFFAFQQVVLMTNIYLALGAGCISYACSSLQGLEHHVRFTLIAMLYILSMQIFNHLTRIRADHFNAPERAAFYQKNMWTLAVLAFAAGGFGLFLAYTTGPVAFVLLLIMSLLGLSYKLRIIPGSICSGRYQRLQDIPGSKTILIALAWGIVTSALPTVSTSGRITAAAVPAFVLATGMVFVRTAFFDILDIQGDRIVGRETLPILLGEPKTVWLLKAILLLMMLMLPIGSILGLTSGLGIILSICPMLMLALLIAQEKGYLLPGIMLEFSVESLFILTGLLTFLWSLFP
jgi:4-hydroxy-3-methylbut-2-enyl diphosphate reductase